MTRCHRCNRSERSTYLRDYCRRHQRDVMFVTSEFDGEVCCVECENSRIANYEQAKREAELLFKADAWVRSVPPMPNLNPISLAEFGESLRRSIFDTSSLFDTSKSKEELYSRDYYALVKLLLIQRALDDLLRELVEVDVRVDVSYARPMCSGVQAIVIRAYQLAERYNQALAKLPSPQPRMRLVEQAQEGKA